MTLIDTPGLGLEEIQRQALFVLMDGLNNCIDLVSSHAEASDAELAQRKGIEFVPTTVEHVELNNFVEGHRPSLISASVTDYPNCAVWAIRSTPTPESNAFDQLSVHRDSIYIEVMVKSIVSEEEVNRRIIRTAEAVFVAMNQNRDLNGTVSGFESDPVVDISDVFTRKERTSYGEHFFWQGARLEYAVRKEAVYTTASPTTGSIFRSVSSIDQA